MNSCKNKRKTHLPSRWDGSEARKPQRHNALPLDVMAFSEEDQKNFWSKVEIKRPKDCWPWIAAVTHDGYGRYTMRRQHNMAHRVAFRMKIGEIPKGLCVCHHCDNPGCCNPSHLWLGTNWDNSLDSLMKGRLARGKRNGAYTHPEKIRRGKAHPFKINPMLHAFGESVNTAKLTASHVIAIRRFYATGKHTMQSLAMRFKISKANIDFIVKGKTWKHLL